MAIFDNNMAVGKSENLVTLHPHDLTQPFLRGCSDLAKVEIILFSSNLVAHAGPPRQGRQARFDPCLDFGFQYALIKNNRSKNLG